jgi:amidophosphoribosyltransferase
MPTRNELLATGRTDDEIAREIGADAVIYQDLDALIAAVRKADNPAIQGFDSSCFNGEYITGDVTPAYLAAIEAARCEPGKQGDAALSSSQLDLNLNSE